MEKRLLVVVLMLVFMLSLVGCGGGGSEAPTPPENGNGVGEENDTDAVDDDVADEADETNHEGGLFGYWPLYPGATFVEEEDTPTKVMKIFVYESDDDVGEIYNWYLDNLKTVSQFNDVEVDYESDEFYTVKAMMYIKAWDDTIYDTIQIDTRSRDNTQLRFIVNDLDNLPGT